MRPLYEIASVLGEEFLTIDHFKEQSTEDYFNHNQFSIDAFKKKYVLYEGETYYQAIKRVCDAIASVEETEELRQYWSDRWLREILYDWWHPAGSIMQGAGNTRSISLANCTYISLGTGLENEEWDNLESIIRNTGYTVAKAAAFRQGLGVDFSRIRPRSTKVYNSSNESQGAVHWMKWIDQIGYFVGQLGRIPAFLFSINVGHPDVLEFIEAKKDYTIIQNANISVQCTEAFYDAVEKDLDWEMSFEIPEQKKGDKIYVNAYSALPEYEKDEDGYYYIARKDRPAETIVRKKRAKEILEFIAKHMASNAEPGIQNIDLAKKWSNSDYVYDEKAKHNSTIQGTNACSEQYLSNLSCCILSSINCGKFSVENYDKELEIIGESINRFLDNVNEYELTKKTFINEAQEEAIRSLRRTGAGITNICAWLLKNNLEYGTPEANEAFGNFAKRYNYWLYSSSIRLGKEKGSFGLFNREKLENSPFIQRMVEQGLSFEALRNITVSSYAPVGCSTAETKINTIAGIKTIRDLFNECGYNLDEVAKQDNTFFSPTKDFYVRDANGSLNKITKLYVNRHDGVRNMEFDNGDEISCTLYHKFLVRDKDNPEFGIWKAAIDITEDDDIISIAPLLE